MALKYSVGGFDLGFDTWGDPTHEPVLFFHGFPGSRIQARAVLPLIKENGLYLIAVDRPGYGETRGQGSPARYLEALAALLDHLGVSRFHVIGVSGGSPWAHLMTAKFADRIDSLTIICGLAPFNRETQKYFSTFQRRALIAGRWVPKRLAHWVVARKLRTLNPDKNLLRLVSFLDTADHKVLLDPAHGGLLKESLAEARKQGPLGIVNDAKLYHRNWYMRDCDLEKLRSVPTAYYHGKNDKLLDCRLAEWMHRANPKSRLTLFEGEGHYSLPFHKVAEILTDIRRHL